MLGLPLSPTRLFQQLFLCKGYCAAVFTGNPSLSGSAHSPNETGLAYTADTIDLDPLLPAGMDFRGPRDSDSHSEAETLQYILSDNEDSVGDDDAIPAGAGQWRRCRETPELLREAALRSDVLQPLQRQPGVETLQHNPLGNTNCAGDDDDIPAFAGHPSSLLGGLHGKACLVTFSIGGSDFTDSHISGVGLGDFETRRQVFETALQEACSMGAASV